MQTIRRADAMRRQIGHQFIPGVGYVSHSVEPEIDPHPQGGKNCAPPKATNDGSFHHLRHAGGSLHVMKWVAAERAWAPLRPGDGNRLAWTVEYLSKHGWEYIKAAPAPATKATKI